MEEWLQHRAYGMLPSSSPRPSGVPPFTSTGGLMSLPLLYSDVMEAMLPAIGSLSASQFRGANLTIPIERADISTSGCHAVGHLV